MEEPDDRASRSAGGSREYTLGFTWFRVRGFRDVRCSAALLVPKPEAITTAEVTRQVIAETLRGGMEYLPPRPEAEAADVHLPNNPESREI